MLKLVAHSGTIGEMTAGGARGEKKVLMMEPGIRKPLHQGEEGLPHPFKARGPPTTKDDKTPAHVSAVHQGIIPNDGQSAWIPLQVLRTSLSNVQAERASASGEGFLTADENSVDVESTTPARVLDAVFALWIDGVIDDTCVVARYAFSTLMQFQGRVPQAGSQSDEVDGSDVTEPEAEEA